MKLQLAYDGIHLDDAVRCIEQIQEYVDIIEIGTPFVLSVGMEGVRTMRRLFPEKEILADMKIMDGGKKKRKWHLKAVLIMSPCWGLRIVLR